MTKWKAPEPVEMEPVANWLLRVVRSLEDHVNGSRPIPPMAELFPQEETRERFIRQCRRQVGEEEGVASLYGWRLDALDPEALLWAARALGAMYARAIGLPQAPRTKD